MAYNKTPFKMYGKSPMMKALVGKQGNLPMHLQEKIKAAPESPAKKYGHSPVKQTDTKIKDIPEVLENTGKKVLEKGKKVIKDIGNITLSSKERKACKEKGGRFKKGKCYMPESPAKQVEQESAGVKDVMTGKDVRRKVRQESTGERKKARKARKAKEQEDLKEAIKNDTPISPAKKYKSPAKKKGCKYGKSPAKQAKSKKEMKYDKTAQKAENAAVSGKVRKNSRLVNRANKMNKKNNLGKGKIAKM